LIEDILGIISTRPTFFSKIFFKKKANTFGAEWIKMGK
jgi:hypothetical protein